VVEWMEKVSEEEYNSKK